MLTLASLDTLAGAANTAAAITYTITGAEVNAGVPTYKVLAQGQLAAAPATIYTAPTSPSSALVKTIHLANTAGTPIAGVRLFVSGTAPTNQISGSFTIPANGWATVDQDGWRIYDANGALQTVGNTGSTGAQGPAGPATFLEAEQGEQGDIGPPGPTGQAGAPGATGTPGMPGAAIYLVGEQGEDGDPGPPGPTGQTGAPGTPGAAIYLVGEQGEDGDPGPPGQVGPAGPQGSTGTQGPPGPALYFLDNEHDDPDEPVAPKYVTPQPLSALVYDVVQTYGARDDLVTVFDGAVTTGTPNLACATSTPFKLQDVGKRITVSGAGASGAQLVTTILTFTDSGHVVLAANAGTTVSAAGTSFGTDNGAAIQNAINAAGNAGGGIVFFPVTNKGRYGSTAQLTVSKPGVLLWGVSPSHTTDIGDYTKTGGSWLCWWGTSSGTLASPAFLQIAPVTGASNPALTGSGIDGLSFDCRNGDQNNILVGIQGLSCHGAHWRNFYVNDALAVGIDLNVVGTLGEARDFTRFLFDRFCIRQLDNPTGAVTTAITTSSAVALTTTPQSLTVAANTLPTAGFVWIETNLGYPVLVNYTGGGGTTTLTGCAISAAEQINAPSTVNGSNVVQAVPGNGACMRLDGDTTANTCCSIIQSVQLSHGTTWGPAAMEFRNADSIECMGIMINGGNATNDGAINRIRKPGVRHCGSNTSATLASRNNTYRGSSAGVGGCSVIGVNNAGTRLAAMSSPNYWEAYQLSNAESLPVVEGGTYFCWWPNGGFAALGHPATPSVADQAIAAATLTLLTGSLMMVPPQGFQIGTVFRWTITGTAVNAGTAANTITVRMGTAGTTADAIVATFTTGVGAATAGDTFRICIELTIRTLGAAATAVATCMVTCSNTAGAAGSFIAQLLNMLTGTMSTFNSTTAQMFVHVDITTGASKTLTVRQAFGEIVSPSNP